MTWPEIALAGISVCLVPWCLFLTRTLQQISRKLERIGADVKWTRREHEAEGGVQMWKNPGFTEAIDKLGEQIERFGDRIETLLRELVRARSD